MADTTQQELDDEIEFLHLEIENKRRICELRKRKSELARRTIDLTEVDTAVPVIKREPTEGDIQEQTPELESQTIDLAGPRPEVAGTKRKISAAAPTDMPKAVAKETALLAPPSTPATELNGVASRAAPPVGPPRPAESNEAAETHQAKRQRLVQESRPSTEARHLLKDDQTRQPVHITGHNTSAGLQYPLLKHKYITSRHGPVNDDLLYCSVVRSASLREYVSLKCCFCDGNSSVHATSPYFRGLQGVLSHMSSTHKDEEFNPRVELDRLVASVLTPEEMKAVDERDHSFQVVSVLAEDRNRRQRRELLAAGQHA
jgi:hypothetical protein